MHPTDFSPPPVVKALVLQRGGLVSVGFRYQPVWFFNIPKGSCYPRNRRCVGIVRKLADLLFLDLCHVVP